MLTEPIKKKINDLEVLMNKVEEAESKGQVFGYAGVPHILHKAREIGFTNVFLVASDYHGHYEDDDCYFTYWDEVHKEFLHDEWSTRFAAPSYDYYEALITFKEAWDAGLIDRAVYLEMRRDVYRAEILRWELPQEVELPGFRVKVDRGRKWRGEGILKKIEEKRYRYATPTFHRRGGNGDFGINARSIATIWDPETKEFVQCNALYLEYIDAPLITSAYQQWAIQQINQAELGPDFLRLQVNLSLDEFLRDHMKDFQANTEEMESSSSLAKEKVMQKLIEWVKTHTDKQGDDILRLAEHIYNKRYANN